MENNDSFFSDFEIIHTYTKEDAVNDGSMINLSQQFPNDIKEAGILGSVYCTISVFNNYIEMNPVAEKACNDIKGRLWDLIWMSRAAMKKTFSTGEEEFFIFYCVTTEIKPNKCICKVIFDGESFIILEKNED